MKKTRKQYYPQVQYKKFRQGEWTNIMQYYVNGSKRYASSLEEAKQAIENTRQLWSNDKPTVQKCGVLSVEIEPFKDNTFEIVATRIRVREVTDWEDVVE